MLGRYLSVLLSGVIILLLSITADARSNMNLNISLVSEPPLPPTTYIAVGPPQGYSHCYMTAGGWMGNVWVPPHRECVYPGSASASLWVSGYWGCVSVGPGGRCGHWEWYSHRMARGRGERLHYGENRPYHRGHWER